MIIKIKSLHFWQISPKKLGKTYVFKKLNLALSHSLVYQKIQAEQNPPKGDDGGL